MTDLVERLRRGAGHIPADIMDAEKAMDEAADEIERCYGEIDRLRSETWGQRSEIERLRWALVDLIETMPSGTRGSKR